MELRKTKEKGEQESCVKSGLYFNNYLKQWVVIVDIQDILQTEFISLKYLVEFSKQAMELKFFFYLFTYGLSTDTLQVFYMVAFVCC